METIKILIIYGGTLKKGGMETYLINYFNQLQGNGFQIDFIVTGKEKGVYDDYITSKQGNVYYVSPRSKGLFKNINEMKKIICNNHYDIVHCHMDAANYYGLKVAYKCGVKVRIAHSHNTAFLTKNKLKLINLKYIKKKIPNYSTHLFACSKVAGAWLYEDAFNLDKPNCYVIPNAIETDRFKFNPEERHLLKEKLGLENKIIIGHVGRFDYQKNHEYILDIIDNMHTSNIKLLLFGEGHLKNTIEERAKQKKIEDNIIFMGNKNDIQQYYNIMDVFILPSLFEGLPLTAIEAQANGLKVLLSSKITDEVAFDNKIKFIDINKNNIDDWCNEILNYKYDLNERKCSSTNNIESLKNNNYDVISAGKYLENIYKGLVSVKQNNIKLYKKRQT